jgi:DNA-binding protein HU-beta
LYLRLLVNRSELSHRKGCKLNKRELVAHVADQAQLTKKQAAEAVEAILGGIAKSIKKGDKVSLVGFGTFSVKERKARKGIIPGQPGRKVNFPAKKVPHFKPGKA